MNKQRESVPFFLALGVLACLGALSGLDVLDLPDLRPNQLRGSVLAVTSLLACGVVWGRLTIGEGLLVTAIGLMDVYVLCRVGGPAFSLLVA